MPESQPTALDVIGSIDLGKSDGELGEWLVATWLGFQAEKHGIPLRDIPRDFAVRLIEETAKIDSDSVENAALESAFRKACTGDYETAGRMLREYCRRSAHGIAMTRFASVGIPVRIGRAKGGKKGGQAARIKAEALHKNIIKDARAMLDAGTAPRDLAGKLARKYSRTPTQVRSVLQMAGILHRRKQTKAN